MVLSRNMVFINATQARGNANRHQKRGSPRQIPRSPACSPAHRIPVSAFRMIIAQAELCEAGPTMLRIDELTRRL